MRVLFGMLAILAVVKISNGCSCAIRKFKLSSCSKKNLFNVHCATPVLSEDCSVLSTNCTSDNKLGSITSSELTVEGFLNLLPINVKVARACADSSSTKKISVSSLIENNVMKICEDIGNEKFSIEIPLNQQERIMLRTLVGSHRFTVKAKKLNGNSRNEVCKKVEMTFYC